MKIIKILHVIPGYGGGISSFVKNLISSSDENLFEMDIVGFNLYPKEFEGLILNKGGKLYTLTSVHKDFLLFIKELRELLSSEKYDVMHCHFSGYRGYVFKVMARMSHVPFIITHAHRTFDEGNRGFIGLISKRLSQGLSKSFSDEYVTCSQMAAEYIFGKKISQSNQVTFMPNSVNFDRFTNTIDTDKRIRYFEEFAIPDNCLVIGHIGRFNFQKNHKMLLNISKQLCDEKIEFCMLFLGSGELEEEIKKAAIDLQLQENVRFLGFRQDVPDIMQIFDIMLLPSFFEGLPTVAVESQAVGIPAILSDTITTEVDLGLGLIKYLPIEDVEGWVKSIKETINFDLDKNDVESRRYVFETSGFTLLGLSEKYKQMIWTGVGKK